MTLPKWLLAYAFTLTVFLALDMLWLGVLASDLYSRQFGDLMAEQVNWLAAFAFYLLFIAGVLVFVVRPALGRGSWRHALGYGAFFGLVTYATYDLTNLATLQGFPEGIVAIDLAWGAVLCALTSVSSYLFIRKLSS
jgi:uncharacterized membrane protein